MYGFIVLQRQTRWEIRRPNHPVTVTGPRPKPLNNTSEHYDQPPPPLPNSPLWATAVPALIGEGREAVSVSCGAQHTVVATSAGELWTWGAGDCGQLGCGLRVTRAAYPRRIMKMSRAGRARFTTVVSGWAHNIALSEKGEAGC